MRLTRTLSRTLRERMKYMEPILRKCNDAGMDFQTAARKAKVSIPTAMKYAKIINLAWKNYKPRGTYSREFIKTK